MVRFTLPAALGLILLSGPSVANAGKSLNARVADSAGWHLRKKPRLKQNDCSGLVCAILKRAGKPTSGNARTMWRDAMREGRVTQKPQPGDLVFFDYTYDRNRNGKVDDPLTHVGVIQSIEGKTLVVVHRGSRGITPLRVTPSTPGVHKRGKHVLNDFLRKPGYGPRNGPRLSGQLVRGYARPPGVSTRPAVRNKKKTARLPPTRSPQRWNQKASVFD